MIIIIIMIIIMVVELYGSLILDDLIIENNLGQILGPRLHLCSSRWIC